MCWLGKRKKSLTEDHLGDVAIVLFVDLNRDSFAVVPDGDQVVRLVYFNLDAVHPRVPLEVVGSID